MYQKLCFLKFRIWDLYKVGHFDIRTKNLLKGTKYCTVKVRAQNLIFILNLNFFVKFEKKKIEIRKKLDRVTEIRTKSYKMVLKVLLT